ncbi:MAG: hypothetical protein UX57_C0003G0022 [Candidatus Uhrbacteria bacterium GW2011_GWE2_46_68]|uniref:Putative membrane protein insertion efficiency factor n=2 Tax=Candidatus Uhriibacteriota TaxID=1752732 RepID=A0A0G1Q9M5_9BACT|nr:MAG: hypothetical protein UX45_C0005G0015 [Candidatus Uhrbacteria bacterium GW2011_GWF2_46_218]KKU41522.1 MAG: hypothetical protein UX57_C0003G0022 [Candidatus Uhrbacteria bacterium GW2011_GWE2_46_68]
MMFFRFPSIFIAFLISIYQKTLSFDHGLLRIFRPYGSCRYYPTCSEYGRVAILRFGVFKGCYLAFRRVLHCTPFSPGGFDPVPEKKKQP